MPKPPLAALRLPASMRRAIIFNWGPRPEPKVEVPVPVGTVMGPGKGTVQKLEAEEARIALLSKAPVSMECLATLLYAWACILGWGRAKMLVSAVRRAPLTPERE